MTRNVGNRRQVIHERRKHGLVTEFVIFFLLRSVDLCASLAVLGNAWEQSKDWADLDSTLFNITETSPTTTVTPNLDSRCKGNNEWDKKDVDSAIKHYDTILWLTLFFNVVSLTVFFTHFSFWVATLKIAFQSPLNEKDDRIERVTRSSLLSLTTAAIRDVPLSCLNTELLIARTGREGLACIACISTRGCSIEGYVGKSLDTARGLLYFSYTIALINSLWKGVSGFYRLSRFENFRLHIIRATASIVFAFFYCATTFTPAMLILIYRYFTIPGFDSKFAHGVAERIVVIGGVVWVIGGTMLLCCPLLSAIRLTSE